MRASGPGSGVAWGVGEYSIFTYEGSDLGHSPCTSVLMILFD